METIYQRLRAWRSQQARELQVPPFFVLSNAHLAGLAAARPTTPEELAHCRGMGPKKLVQFGPMLVEQVAQCLAEGLEPGVTPSESPPPASTPPTLTDEDLADIAAGLRKELALRLTKRFKGRFTVGQVEDALRRLSWSA